MIGENMEDIRDNNNKCKMDLTGHKDGGGATGEHTEKYCDKIIINIRQTGQGTETEKIEKGEKVGTLDGHNCVTCLWSTFKRRFSSRDLEAL